MSPDTGRHGGKQRSASSDALTATEWRAVSGLSTIFAIRMLGMFFVLPVFGPYASRLEGATLPLVGLALGAYGLTQTLLQIPFGMLSDRFGRKPLIALGLLLFAAGSLLAAWAQDIHTLVLARLLQGSGAIASVAIAMAADFTREQVRTRAMAVMGMGIGVAFTVGILAGPPVAARFGVPAIFAMTAALSMFALLFLWVGVPSPPRVEHHDDAEVSPGMLGKVLRDPNLLRLDLGMFVLHMSLTAVFLAVPFLLQEHLAPHALWKVYTPMVLVGVAVMVPVIVVAERRHRLKEGMLLGLALVAASTVLFALSAHRFSLLVAALLIYFAGFNILEPIMPSLVTRLSGAQTRGTAMGVFNMSEFLGAFAGGSLGGLLMQRNGTALFLGLLVAVGVWAVVTLGLRVPRPDQSSSELFARSSEKNSEL